MKRKLLSFVFAVLLLTGCDKANTPAIPEVSSIPKPTAILTYIPSMPPTHLPNPTLTIPLNTRLIKHCLQIGTKDAQLQSIAIGTIVPRNQDNDYIFYLADIQTGSRYNFHYTSAKNTEPLLGMHVSPDGNKLAYVEPVIDATGHTTKQKIWVLNAKGEVLASHTIKPEILFSEWRWLDNERLQFHSADVTVKDGTVIIWNISTQKWEYLRNNLPNFYNNFDVSPVWWLIDYSSNLEWVAYLGIVDGYGLRPIIWDVKKQKMVWQATDSIWGEPKWSPSGGEIALTMNGNLYRIDINGQVKPLPDTRKIISFD